MIKSGILKLFHSFGLQLVRVNAGFTQEELAAIEKVKQYTVTSAERLTGLIDAVRYVVANKIEGDLVECGVWRGGSMMAAMHTLLKLGDTSRNIYLFDTFEGMAEPTDSDVMYDGQKAKDLMAQDTEKWCLANIEEVQQNVLSTGYPKQKIHLIKGKVEDTIPARAPAKIALLRLDTDWYESTAHEMKHLYPRLVEQGVLIIDDYGHWQGARRAVDEYFGTQPFRPMLNRLDYTGRLLVKPPTD